MGAYINGDYKSEYSGDQIDAAIGKVRTPDSTPTASSDNLVTSGGVKAALDQKQAVINDLSTIRQGASDGTAALTATNEIEQVIAQGYKYYGVATPSTNPGTLEQKVFYIASQPGTYTNLGGIVVNDGEVCTLMWNETSWSKQVTGAATAAQVSQLGQEVEEMAETTVALEENAGFIAVNGYVTQASGYYHSQSIHLYKGETIIGRVSSITSTNNVAVVSKLIKGLSSEKYTPLVIGGTGSDFTYTAPEDCDVYISGKYDDASVDISSNYVVVRREIIKTKDDLALLQDYNINLVTNDGFVSTGGTITPSPGYYHSQDIQLYKGESIIGGIKGTASVAILAKKVNGNYTTLQDGSAGYTEFEYIATEDCVVVVSGAYTDSDSVIVKTSYKREKVFEDSVDVEKIESLNDVIVFAGTECIPAAIKNSENFATYFEAGKYLSVTSETTAPQTLNYANAATMYLDKTKMIPLEGGRSYNVNVPFVTDNTGCAVYNEGLNYVFGYSKTLNTATKDGLRLTFTVDLSNREGTYYLRLSISNSNEAPSTCSAVLGQSYIKETSNGGSESNNYWNDSLKLSKNKNLDIKSGTYGSPNAKYKIAKRESIGRIAVDFNVNTDTNVDADDIVLAEVGNTNIGIICAAPTLLQEAYSDDNVSYVQDINYNSGFYIGGHQQIRKVTTYKPIVGDVALMVWLKGSTSSTEPTSSELSTRASWLEDNQDYILKVENDTLSIERNGIGNDGNTFNGGATSVIFSTSLLSSGTYKTVAELYEELSALDYLVVKMVNTDARKSCEDLAQFGTVRMVGCYNQQIDRSVDDVDYYYDSYPVPLRYKVDESIHTLEILFTDAQTYVIIDGWIQAITFTGNEVVIGGNGITLSNLEVWSGSFGDDAVFNADKSVYASKRSPALYGLMGHATFDTYDGGVSGASQSTSRLESLCTILHDNQYNVIDLAEFGRDEPMSVVKRAGNKVALFIFDDLNFVPLYMNKEIRSHVSRHGYSMNFAVIHSQLAANPSAQSVLLPMRLNGWCCASHSLKHDVPIPRKNSISLYWELEKILDDCDIYNFVNNILVYNWSGAWANTYNMLKLCGFVSAINSGGGVGRLYHNQYNIPRTNIADASITLENFENKLVK